MKRRAFPALGRVALLAALIRCNDPPPPPAPDIALREAQSLLRGARDEVLRREREALERSGLFVPPDRDGPVPLLVLLHGLGGTGRGLAESLQFSMRASAAGFAYQAPEGSLDHSGRQFWNASASCCNFDDLNVDHLAVLRELVQRSVADPRIDGSRVYLVGYSNGGFMAQRAACELADLFRGVVSISGAGPGKQASCRPQKRVSVLLIHGDADPIVRFTGGYLFADRRRPRHPSAQRSAARWASWNGCSRRARHEETLDLDPRIHGGETDVFRYECPDAPVELWRIRGGDHSSGLSRRAISALFRFIRKDVARP